MRWLDFTVLAALMAGPVAWGQAGMERPATAASLYPREWPAGPRRDAMPEWARPGRLRFARWDGGPMETAKYFLSGYPGYNPPIPDYIYSMTNWYTPPTIELLREAGVNFIWVTFSMGFSNVTEAPQQEQLREYIRECHRNGIHVMAYESVGNIFWEDFFEHVPEGRDWVAKGKDGKPVPYGAGDYSKMGRVTRYMADLTHPKWRALLRQRVDLAIDAGADGIHFDNNFGVQLADIYQDIYRHATSRKSDFLLMGNFHENTYSLNRLTNCISTEDGLEPGVHALENFRAGKLARDAASFAESEGGVLVNNIGLFRLLRALSRDWKPVLVENGQRERGVRETTPMSARRHQISLAEAMMFSAASELFVDGTFGHDLFRRTPEAMEIWRAVGKYNRFFDDNHAYYEGARSAARLAVVLDDRSKGVTLLNGLAARNVIYDVIYDFDVTPEVLARYRALLIATANPRERARDAIEAYRAKGGTVLTLDSQPNYAELAQRMKAGEPTAAVRVEAPAGVLYNWVRQEGSDRLMVHLLNYNSQPVKNVRVHLPGEYTVRRLLSPDESRGDVKPAAGGVELPVLDVYSVLVLEKGVSQ